MQLLAAFAATVAVLFVLLLGACALPAQPVLEHVYDSAQTIQQEGLYPEYFGFKLFQMDNYTDTIMLFEAAAMGEQDPLTAMMTATAYNVDNFETMAGDLAAYCERTIPLATGAQKAVQLVPFSYARYWHGYLIWLRPLLCVMSITGVRVVQYLVLFALLAVILWQLRRQCGLRAMVWFAVSQLAVTVFWVPHQVQYFTTFCIAYAGCAWVLARPRRAGQLSIALVVLGTCTAFCDLLVTPIITLGLPVAVWLCCLPQRAASGARQCLSVIGGSLCWGAGYAMCWGLKWVLATLITGQDIIGDAIHQAGVRTTADTWHGMELSWGNIFRFVGDTLSQRGLLWPVVLVVILCIAAFLLCLRNKEALLRALPIGLTALMAPVWLALLRTHSIQHGWFTWRSLTVSIFAGLAFLYYSCGIRTGLRRLRGQKSTRVKVVMKDEENKMQSAAPEQQAQPEQTQPESEPAADAAQPGTTAPETPDKKKRPLWLKLLAVFAAALAVLVLLAVLYINGKLDLIHYDDGTVDSVGTVDAEEDQNLDTTGLTQATNDEMEMPEGSPFADEDVLNILLISTDERTDAVNDWDAFTHLNELDGTKPPRSSAPMPARTV